MTIDVTAPVAYRHCYIHVPFCARRCTYCDFAIAVRKVVPWREYADALAAEWSARDIGSQTTLDTLYFGGGTPSILGVDGVQHVMNWARQVAHLSAGAEVTLEANPEDITTGSVAAWHKAGINRLSIGVQSFDDSVLRWMHRVHDAGAAARAAQVARDGGIPAFSLDLIFALPASLNRDWRRDLDIALSLTPDHISLYGLTVEPHTPLGRLEARGEVSAAPEEQYEEQFLAANERLTDAGYEHYEVSNFAMPGKRAVHNSAYWSGAPYLGLGPSAHGFSGAARRWNEPVYARWLEAALAGNDPLSGSETLDAGNRLTEQVYLGLRTRDGLPVGPADAPLVDQWLGVGWVEQVAASGSQRVRCTTLGWLRLDGLASALTALRSH
ncbi:MAG: radical SAM family heme chaperone HemW [Phycisphaerae bacterium]|nr:radical SAM family heme chaperone HemW [Gemmatimonadaceae bacterium]